MYAPFFLIFEGRKAAGTRIGADSSSGCFERRRPRRILYAAGVQTGRGNDDFGGRGLRRRNGLPRRRDDHACVQHAVLAGAVDAVAMFAMGIIGWLAGVLYRKGVLRRGRLSLCIYGVIASTVIFGGIMNPASALMWSNTINWKIILSYYITGIPVDLGPRRCHVHLPVAWRGADAGEA